MSWTGTCTTARIRELIAATSWNRGPAPTPSIVAGPPFGEAPREFDPLCLLNGPLGGNRWRFGEWHGRRPGATRRRPGSIGSVGSRRPGRMRTTFGHWVLHQRTDRPKP